MFFADRLAYPILNAQEGRVVRFYPLFKLLYLLIAINKGYRFHP